MNVNENEVNTKGMHPVEKKTETEIRLASWIKSHKKHLIWAGVGITAITGIVLSIKNKDTLVLIVKKINKTTKQDSVDMLITLPTEQLEIPIVEATKAPRTYTTPTKPFSVSQHIRTMAVDHHHSEERAVAAAELGIELLPNQTLVDSYTKFVT